MTTDARKGTKETMEARAFVCPACGGQVSDQARRCPYCDAPIATVRCAGCYYMNAPDALHCAGCGRELGLEPIAEPSKLTCPDCRLALSAFRADDSTLYDCGKCGGQFVEHALLHALLERREVYGRAAPRPIVRASSQPKAVRYVHCPACGSLMNRKNLGRSGA
jgi:DNA-directed RNA polymerase subunit RPC12/RpoP